jgi:metacaspase-1
MAKKRKSDGSKKKAHKRAFCVGINDYPYDGSDLNGCVNDANAWAGLLIDHYDFPRSDVKILTDAQATRSAIMKGLKELLAGARKGDVLVFTNSSHGTYQADDSGDEARYDEALCPYDVADNLIVDDDLRKLFANLPAGVHLTVISDSCHSGTVTRAAVSENFPGMKTPDHRRVRFLNPGLRGDPVISNPWKARPKGKDKYPESDMKEVLLSGCTDREYSYDALLDGTYHGAMTFYALQTIREASYRLTYAQLHSGVRFLLDENAYPQHPQLEGAGASKRRQLFT